MNIPVVKRIGDWWLNNLCDDWFQVLSYMKAYGTFFHQGSDLMQDLEPSLANIDEEVSETSFLLHNFTSLHFIIVIRVVNI